MSDSRENDRQLLGAASSAAAANVSIIEAYVQDVDLLRKTVKVVFYDTNVQSNWLRTCWSMVGDNSFAGAMPSVNENVLVAFPKSNRNAGVVIGQIADPDMTQTYLGASGSSGEITYLIKTQANDEMRFHASGGITVISNHVTVLSDDVKIGTAGNSNLQQFLVRYDKLKDKLDDHIAKFNGHFHTGNLGAPTTPPLIQFLVGVNNDYATNSIKAK